MLLLLLLPACLPACRPVCLVSQVLELVRCPAVRNRDLYVLAHSPLQLQSLTLGDDTNRPWVTNRGLVSIGHMCTLQQLALHDCNSITNNGLTCLAGLASLVSLSLRGCRKITNNGLEVLAALTGLSSLNLYGCSRISDLGVPLLEGLPLRALSLGMTRVRDEGVGHLVSPSGCETRGGTLDGPWVGVVSS